MFWTVVLTSMDVKWAAPAFKLQSSACNDVQICQLSSCLCGFVPEKSSWTGLWSHSGKPATSVRVRVFINCWLWKGHMCSVPCEISVSTPNRSVSLTGTNMSRNLPERRSWCYETQMSEFTWRFRLPVSPAKQIVMLFGCQTLKRNKKNWGVSF